MKCKLKYGIWTLLIIFLITPTQGNVFSALSLISEVKTIHEADSLFDSGNYTLALVNYSKVDSLSPLLPQTLFRKAYAQLRIGAYRPSAQIFKDLYTSKRFIPKFSRYFFIRSLWNFDPDSALKESIAFITDYNKSALADSFLVPVAEKLEKDEHYLRSRTYFLKALKKRVNPGKNALYAIKAADAWKAIGRKKQAINEYDQIIKKYKSSAYTLELCVRLENEENFFSDKNFFPISDVYFANQRYKALKKRMEQFIIAEKEYAKKEKARFYLLKTYFSEKRYTSALYGFKTLLKNLKDKKLEAKIRLYIARTYYRLHYKEKAIAAYIDYSKRYPRRRIASETVWKAAWINEELKKTNEALSLYKRLRQKWPQSPYAKEASFREGFAHYRMGNIEEADQIFSQIRFRKWPDIHKNRAQFWSSLCRDKMGDHITSRRLRIDLAQNMWDDYYTMKSYMYHKDHIDTTSKDIAGLKRNAHPMPYFADGYAQLLPKFEEAFIIRGILGDKYGQIALNNIKLKIKTQGEWVALAEIYKRIGKYGKAFQVYDIINKKYYRNVTYFDKAFILKERFPLSYNEDVVKYANRYQVEQELIWAVMKQESAFRSTAHSWANAWGLMQLMPYTAKDMAKRAKIKLRNNRQLYNPGINVRLGSIYLKQLTRQFKGQKEHMLAAYNAGPSRVKRWRKIPGSDEIDVFIENIEFKETRGYVRNVMKNYWAYKLLNNNFELSEPETRYSLAY